MEYGSIIYTLFMPTDLSPFHAAPSCSSDASMKNTSGGADPKPTRFEACIGEGTCHCRVQVICNLTLISVVKISCKASIIFYLCSIALQMTGSDVTKYVLSVTHFYFFAARDRAGTLSSCHGQDH